MRVADIRVRKPNGDENRVVVAGDVVSLPGCGWSLGGFGNSIERRWLLEDARVPIPGDDVERELRADAIVKALDVLRTGELPDGVRHANTARPAGAGDRPAEELLPDFPDSRMGQDIEDYARGALAKTPAGPQPLRLLKLTGSAMQCRTVGELAAELDQIVLLVEDWRLDLVRLGESTAIDDQANRCGRTARERLTYGRGHTTPHRAFDHARAVRG